MPKRIALLFLSLLSLSVSMAQPGPVVSESLRERMKQAPDSAFSLFLVGKDQVDISVLEKEFQQAASPFPQRAFALITALQELADLSQADLLPALSQVKGVELTSIQPYWISNLIQVRANFEALEALQDWPQFSHILPDLPVELEAFREGPAFPRDLGQVSGVELGLEKINAPALWAMGYTGYGRMALNIDSGVDGTHPALAGRYKGLTESATESWFDPRAGTTYPDYCDDHGTHVLGIMLGLDPDGDDTVGVAFGARWMGVPAICDGLSSDNLAAFQWALDPDDDPATYDVPDVINNSWRAIDLADECSDPLYIPALTALEMAGIAVVFSAGNSGPDSASITAPKNISQSLTNTFTVAALNGNAAILNILGFSSRGPSICANEDTSSLAIKPEVSAPGFQVRSTELNGTYGRKSGTSMAAPHVSGGILLLKEAFPSLSGTQLKEALYYSCLDLGDVGEDNEYGMGMIDLMAAFQWLVNQGHVPVEVHSEYDAAITAIGNLPAVLCDSVIQPSVVLTNRGEEILSAAKLVYQYESGLGGNVNWSGLLLPDSSVLVNLPMVSLPAGPHELEVEASELNGGEVDYHYLDNRLRQTFFLSDASLFAPSPVVVCDSNAALLTAYSQNSGTVRWYESPSSQQVVAEGNAFLLPVASGSDTYYAALYPKTQVGMAGTPGGNGSYSPTPDGFLRFDAQQSFVLTSVLVHSNADGYRTITLTDEEGMMKESKVVFLNIGTQRVSLDFFVYPGRQWQLGLTDAGQLFRHESGANYPYEVPGVMRITSSSTGLGSYYYFYEWEIEYQSPCERVVVDVQFSAGEMNAAFLADPDTIAGLVHFFDQSDAAQTWWWDFGDGTFSPETNPSHSYAAAGEYTVSLLVQGEDSCGATTQQQVLVEAGTSTALFAMLENEFQLFPNPTTGLVNGNWSIAMGRQIEILLLDIQGKRLPIAGNLSQHASDFQLDMRTFPAGMYLLQLRHSQGVVTRKLLKQ